MQIAAFQTGRSQVVTTKIQTEPSSGTCLSSLAAMEGAIPEEATSKACAVPVPRDDEPNLYNIPDGVYPIYRPLPIAAKLLVAAASIIMSAVTTWHRLTWLHPLVAIRSGMSTWNVKKIFQFVGKALIAGFVSNTVLQDIFLAPSRLSIDTMLQDYFLPSTLSQYDPVALPPKDGDEESVLGVHFLRYKARNPVSPSRFEALYVNHGFGASSLSWLPALPSLVERVGARVGIGHDAPGFGFTDRPKQLNGYTFTSSANIGTKLLENELQTQGEQPSEPSGVALFGHSMGALATLRMALSLPQDTRTFIVLVAPAVGVSRTPSLSETTRTKLYAEWPRFLLDCVRNVLFTAPLKYLLKRVVGTRNFWKKGLRLAWGDPDRLSDSDALRFQWPSIGKGWERGLLSFSHAQFGVPSDLTDAQLVEKVLARPNTSLTVIYGTKDNIMKPNQIRKFFQQFPQVKVCELDGQGHDPFEEQVDTFVSTIEKILEEGE